MIERWETKILGLERDFNEELSERMKAGVPLNMVPGDIQTSLIQHSDKLENSKITEERVVSIMEAKNEVHPDGHGDGGEEVDFGAVHRSSLCNRCGGKGHYARNCGTPDLRGKGKGKGKDGKDGSQEQAKGSSWDFIYCKKKGHTAMECWKKEREENCDRSANNVDQDACNVRLYGIRHDEP